MKYLAAVLVIGIWAWLAMNVMAATWNSSAFEVPATPLPFISSQTFPSWDYQTHTRDNNMQAVGWDAPFEAEHGSNCEAPPATHTVQAFDPSVFICNGHIMTAANAGGYGLIALTPNQTINCMPSCVIQWSMSTERQSIRDWPDVWVTPWLDNLPLPFDAGDVDLQGVPRQGVHIDLNNSQSAWLVKTIANYSETLWNNQYGDTIQTGIIAGTNQAATRQAFRLTLSNGNHIRLERMSSVTADSRVYLDSDVSVFPTTDLVVQFAHHSYNPTKDGSGVPATWHWSDFSLENAAPFTLIKAAPRLLTADGQLNFAAAPANAFLRFQAQCQVNYTLDGVNWTVAPKQTFIGHYEHSSGYFFSIPAGTTTVGIHFSADGWFGGPCYLQDASVWSKGSTPSPTPTPIGPTPTPTNTPLPTPTNTPVPPTPTATPTIHGTLGITSVGPITDVHDQDVLSGLKVTSPANITLTSLSVYVTNLDNRQASRQYQLAVYADNNGVPGALIANTVIGTLVNNSWNTLPISVPLQAGQNYWFVHNNNGRSTTVNNLVYNNTGVGVYSSTAVTFGTWPSIFPSPVTGNWGYSIYGSY